MADLASLGQQKTRYIAFSIGWNLFAVSVFLLLGGLLFGVPVVDALRQIVTFGSSRIDNVLNTEDFWIPVAFGLLFLVGALVVGINWAVRQHRGIATHEHGLAFYNGRTLESTVRWVDIYALARSRNYDVRQRVTHIKYTLYGDHKRSFSFTQVISGHEALVTECQRQIDRQVGPLYEARLRDGQRVTFGEVSLDSRAVYIGDYATPWSEVRGVQAGAYTIVIQKKTISAEAPQSVTIDRVPNWWIFIRMAQKQVR